MSHFGLYIRPHSPASGRAQLCEVALQLTSTATTRDGKQILTALCSTEQELDRWIDGLIEELNAVRHQGKRRLHRS